MTGLNIIPLQPAATNKLLQFRTVNPLAAPVKRASETHRFSVGDRIRAHSWINHANAVGYGKLVFAADNGQANYEPCEYMLIYRRDVPWAHWGVACRREGYEVWHATSGTTLGVFAKLQEAFDQILAQPD